jgi:hypothetical protein
MTKPKPKIYPAEFKESAVKLAIESNKPMAQTAKELGMMWLYFSGQLILNNINRKEVQK